jgi:hypothetical protein
VTVLDSVAHHVGSPEPIYIEGDVLLGGGAKAFWQIAIKMDDVEVCGVMVRSEIAGLMMTR